MKKFFLVTLILILPVILFSQDLQIPNNPYDAADENIKERNAFKRERWFYEQRMFPDNFIPENAYAHAVDQRNALRQSQGFLLDVNNKWASIGPTSGFYFAYGNISSRITTIKYDPVNPSVIYLGAAYGGVWKSMNGGDTWTAMTSDEASLASGAIAVDPVNTNVVYYGTGEATYSGTSYYGRGLLKSTDGGITWTSYTNGLQNFTFFSRIVVRPGHSNELLAALGSRSSLGASGGIYRSTDAGVTWNVVVSGRCDDVVFSSDGQKAYAIGSGTSYRISTDGGVTFNSSAALTPLTRNHIAICKTSPNILYAATHSGSSINVFKSTDGGITFSPAASGTDFSGSQAWYDFYMYVNPHDPDYAYVGSIDVWRTTNGGTSFANITFGYSGGNVHVDQQNMDFHPTDPDKMMCVNDGGVWRSTNRGTDWTNLNSTLNLTQFYRIASDPSNASHILGGTQDNGTQRTLGTQNWAGAFGGDGGEVCFHDVDNNYILGETQNNGVQRSANGGTSFSSATNGLTGSGSWVAPLKSHPDSAGIFYTARQAVFKTTNWGAGWIPISASTGGTVREMAISKSNPEIMYVTSGSAVLRSTDRGYTFTNTGAAVPSRTITGIYIHPDSSNVVLLCQSGFGGGHIFKTTNGGTNWSDISGNLPDSPANDLLIFYPGMPTSIYLIATDVGVFMSNNYGTSWSELSDGLPNTVAMHLDYNDATSKLRIATHGRGVFEITNLTGISSVNSVNPESFSLEQNYPNPFNPTTNIRYNILSKGVVTLRIYNMLGSEVSTLVNKVQDAGSYNIHFNGGTLSSGVYYYKLSFTSGSNSFTDIKKMLMIK